MSDPLANLQPIHLPPEITWWPPAPGWWLLLLLILTLLLLWRRYRVVRRPQRAALRAMQQIEQREESSQQKVAAINQLLKRYILTSGEDPNAAALTGEAWLQFLDRQSRVRGFLGKSGALLNASPYAPPSQQDAPSGAELTSLVQLSRQWIRTNPPSDNR